MSPNAKTAIAAAEYTRQSLWRSLKSRYKAQNAQDMLQAVKRSSGGEAPLPRRRQKRHGGDCYQ